MPMMSMPLGLSHLSRITFFKGLGGVGVACPGGYGKGVDVEGGASDVGGRLGGSVGPWGGGAWWAEAGRVGGADGSVGEGGVVARKVG